jgi:hypothetical protein
MNYSAVTVLVYNASYWVMWRNWFESISAYNYLASKANVKYRSFVTSSIVSI